MGEYLYREGDTTYDFYVVLSGLVEITIHQDGEERVIISHGGGRFLGSSTCSPVRVCSCRPGWPNRAKSLPCRPKPCGGSSPPSPG